MTKTVGDWHRTKLAIATVASLLSAGAQPLMASRVAVGTCIPKVVQYTTIQAAVNAVTSGSTIEVCPGNYPEQVVINKNLTLRGVSSGSADNPALVIPSGGFVANATSLASSNPIAAQILVESPATAVTISDLAVDGTGNNLNSGCGEPPLIGIYYQNASGRLHHLVARNQTQNAENFGCQGSAGLGIFIESGNSGSSTVSIENSAVRGYQKNGITADEAGTTVLITGNSVVGAGPVDAAQNGIQIGFGATGKVINNIVSDDIFSGGTAAASGILIYDSGDTAIADNSITTTQYGIAVLTDGALPANGNSITNNQIAQTELGDGIDVCSNNNTVTANVVFSSGQSGIHLDSTCGSTGNNNAVSRNTVNEACAGILLGSGPDNNFLVGNEFFNVNFKTLAGDVCSPTVVSSALSSGQTVSSGRKLSAARP